MSFTITDDRMTSDLTDAVATRVDAEAGLWTVTGRHGVYTREQAVTAMTVAELRAHTSAWPNESILIASLEQELLVTPMPRDPWALLQTLKAAAAAVRALPTRETFTAPPFDANLAECLLRIGDAVADLAAATDAISNLAHEHARDTGLISWRRTVDRADEACQRLRGAAEDLRTAGLACQHAVSLQAEG